MEKNEKLLKISDELLMELLQFKTQNPEFTFYLRQTDKYQRLSSGHWFQGSNYIFCPLFKRADGSNPTRNLGFVCKFDSDGEMVQQWIEVLKRGKNYYSKFETSFLDDLIDWLKIKWQGKTNNEKALYFFKNLDFSQNLKFYLTDFRDKCLELIEKYQLDNDYLVTDKEFNKAIIKIAKYREVLGFLEQSSEEAFSDWHKKIYKRNTWKTKKSALTSSLMVYLSSKEIIGEIIPPLEIYFSIFYINDADFIKSLINQIINFNKYVPNSPKSEDSKRQLKTGLEHYLKFLQSNSELNSESIPKFNFGSKQMTQLNHPLNQILYGPPGTGKTYQTTELAVRIAEPEKYTVIINNDDSKEEQHKLIKALYDELVISRRIGFTTFHQSYSYEDFIEGIRVDSDDEDKIRYKVEDGVFKEMVALASGGESKLVKSNKVNDISNKEIWKMSLGDTSKGDEKYQNCIDNSYIGMSYGEDIDFSLTSSYQDIIKIYQEKTGKTYTKKDYPVTSVYRFKNEMKIGDLVIITDGNKKYRAIGEVTGDYECNMEDDFLFYQTRKVNWLKVFEKSLPKDPLFSKGISQMTLYKLKDESIDRSHLNDLLTESSDVKNYVLIIDEINRGNISRIFGELITLLEPDKRFEASDQRTVILPYSKDKFSVPKNLYVIGTMNTADKSLAQMDLALRRRFDFVEMLPDSSHFEGLKVHNVRISNILQTINDRIEVLLDRDHLIGHSYFWSLKSLNNESELQLELAIIFKNKIIPLLQEYFFADWERIRWVLNDQHKNIDNQFIHMISDKAGLSKLFGASEADQLFDRRYQINDNAFEAADAYKGILGME